MIVLLASLAVAGIEAARSGWLVLPHQLTDLRAFYCGGAAVDLRADPYRVEPLRGCEHRLPTAPFSADPAAVAPAPLPGFAFLPFALLARLPFGAAAAVWTLLSITAVGVTSLMLAATLRLERTLVAATLVMSALLASVVQGQLIACELAAIAGTGLALTRGRPHLAGALAASTLFEPHVGLPVVLSVAMLIPRARLAVSAGVALALAASIATLGIAANIEYVMVTLPQQIAAELRYQEQYSLSYALQFAGVDARVASILGRISYLAACVAALAVARRLSRAGFSPAVTAFVPAAFSVIGGPFVHVTQTAAAIPLALTLWSAASTLEERARVAAGLCLVAVAWPYPYESKPLLLASVIAIATIWWYAGRGSWLTTLVAAAVTAAGLSLLENRPRIVNLPVRIAAFRPGDSSPLAWQSRIEHLETHDPAYFCLKVLTWTGLVVIAGIACRTALGTGREPVAVMPPHERALVPTEDLA